MGGRCWRLTFGGGRELVQLARAELRHRCDFPVRRVRRHLPRLVREQAMKQCSIVVVSTNPKTLRKEVWIDGKLIQVLYPPKEGGTW